MGGVGLVFVLAGRLGGRFGSGWAGRQTPAGGRDGERKGVRAGAGVKSMGADGCGRVRVGAVRCGKGGV